MDLGYQLEHRLQNLPTKRHASLTPSRLLRLFFSSLIESPSESRCCSSGPVWPSLWLAESLLYEPSSASSYWSPQQRSQELQQLQPLPSGHQNPPPANRILCVQPQGFNICFSCFLYHEPGLLGSWNVFAPITPVETGSWASRGHFMDQFSKLG